MMRSASLQRSTSETQISVTWDLDGGTGTTIATGIGFFDHMLEALAKHSGTALQVRCEGDLHIDDHHTVEDVGIVLGQALRQALGERRGVERFGHMAVPLDEALVQASVDLSGRSRLVYDLRIDVEKLGALSVEMIPEFFIALTDHGQFCLHLHQISGANGHHICEAAFKACARALRQAIAITGSEVPSTKGVLE